jgi:NAD(P)-dependent dehydrogenase (short-subunit alcohol dehydrogenase family)
MGEIAGGGLYAATTFTVATICGSLKYEFAPFGIDIHCIELGYFATDLLSESNLKFNLAKAIRDYKKLNKVGEGWLATSGNHPGSPKKGVTRMIDAVTKTGYAKGKEVLVRGVSGKDAYRFTGRLLRGEESPEYIVIATGISSRD